MHRRTFLAGAAVTVPVALAGCIDGTSDTAADERNGTDETGDGDDDGDEHDREVVLYEDLPEYDQRFVEKAESNHRVRWIREEDERIYVEQSDDGWVEVTDPVVPENVSSDLQDVIDGDASLKKDGTLYSFMVDVGHGPYGRRYVSHTVDTCETDHVAFDDLAEGKQELLTALVDDGELFVARPDFSNVSNADFFLEIDDERTRFLNETFLSEGYCLAYDDDSYVVDIGSEYILDMQGYELVQVDE